MTVWNMPFVAMPSACTSHNFTVLLILGTQNSRKGAMFKNIKFSNLE